MPDLPRHKVVRDLPPSHLPLSIQHREHAYKGNLPHFKANQYGETRTASPIWSYRGLPGKLDA